MFRLFFSILFLFVFFLSYALKSEENFNIEEPFTSSLVNTESLISTLIDGSISAITGEYVNTQIDFLLQGPESLDFRRLYSAGKWHFNRPSFLKLRGEISGQFKNPSGAITTHKKIGRKKEKTQILELHNRLGLTNCGSREISARTNLNNLKITVEQGSCLAHLPNGDILEMELKGEYKQDQSNTFHAKIERKASGNTLKYVLGWISTYNGDQTNCYSWLHYSYPNNEQLLVQSSDGKTATYTFLKKFEEKQKSITEKYVIKSAEFSHRPREDYEYSVFTIRNWNVQYHTEEGEHVYKNKTYRTSLLTRISKPDNRFETIDYYQEGKNNVLGQMIQVTTEDPILYRIKILHFIKIPLLCRPDQ